MWPELREQVESWCAGRIWWWRLPLLGLLAHQGLRHLGDPEYRGFFSGINFGIHELGHFVFAPFGDWMQAAGGTLTQVAAPLASAAMFFRQPDYFALVVCGGWLATNLYETATYAADAFKMELPLVSPGGGETYHDWIICSTARACLPGTRASRDSSDSSQHLSWLFPS